MTNTAGIRRHMSSRSGVSHGANIRSGSTSTKTAFMTDFSSAQLGTLFLDVLGRTRATLNSSACSPFPRGTGKPLNPIRGRDRGLPLVSRKRSCQSQSTHSKKIYLPPSELSYIRVFPSLNFKFGDKNISSGRDAHPSSSCVVSVETSEIDRKQTSARTELAQRSGQDEGPSASAIKPPADDNDNNNNDVPTEVAKDKKYIEFLIKTKDRGRNGEEVKSMKLKVAPSKKVIVVKKCYVNKLGLDKDKMGELQLMVNGRKLEEEELVDKLDNLTVMADGLWFR